VTAKLASGIEVRLHPDDLQRLAELVAEHVVALHPSSEVQRGAAANRMLTAREVGERYAIDVQWVREHATELGVVRLGQGPKAPLRFDPDAVTAHLASCSTGRRAKEGGPPAREPIQRKPRHRPLGSGSQLLPVRPPKPARRAVRDSF